MRTDRTLFTLARVVPLLIAGGTLHGQVLVTLSTSANSLQGNQTAALQALVTNATSNKAVNWSFSPSVGSFTPGLAHFDPTTGISTNQYQAPAVIATKQTITVTATSIEDPSAAASVVIQLTPIAVTVLVNPPSVSLLAGQTQKFTATVTGVSQTGVVWSIGPQDPGSIDSTGLYTAPIAIAAATKATVTATSVFNGTTGTATVTLQAPPAVAVTVSPTSASLTNNQTQQFTATVTNAANTAVTWSLSPQTGTISANGLYTAPALISGTSKVTVTATSVADSSKSASATVSLSNFVDIGTGAPTLLMQQEFLQAFNRNGFNTLVSVPPLAAVQKSGTTGYLQRFADANKTAGVTFALATVSATAPPLSDGTAAPPVVQLYGGVYGAYTTVGVTTAGYPTMDTQTCPVFDPANSCTYDFFDKGYGLFSYANALATGQNFTIRLAFYTEWTSLGGISGPGRPVDVETAIIASTTTTATVQTYASGAIYTINSGANRNKVFGVIEPLYDLYVNGNGPSGSLGLPTSDAIVLSSGVHRQTFENGALEFTPGGPPVQLAPVTSVALAGASASSVTLNLGSTLTLTATPHAADGSTLTGRPISWSTTNGRVIAIQASGATAVLTAVGGGSANVAASSEGVVSNTLNLIVLAPCCQVGDGAPPAVQQSFQTALVRDQLSVQIPVTGPALRVGNGYVQMLQSSNSNAPATFLIAQSDDVGAAFVVAGAVLARYLSLGGPGGALGYPIGDQSAGGTQLFENSSALAGSPVRLVSGAILSKWALLGYETGTAGPPTAEAAAFSTFGANSGFQQTFANGAIYAATAGPRSGQAYYVTGLILTAYNAIGGALGNFGMPVSDEFVTGGVHQQNFEGGSMTYSPGDSAAKQQPAPKTPGVIVAPTTIAAGGRARLAIVGFPNNATIRVSISGQPDFLVTTANGAYLWDMAIPLAASSGTIAVHAADTHGPAVADGALTIKGFTDNRIQIAKVQGDNQTGAPGAALPLSLRIALLDSSGSPVIGAAVTFQASPGVQLSTSSALTDSSGLAETLVRLPNTQGVAEVTADAPSIARSPVTFGLIAAAASLNNFPNVQQTGAAPLGNGSATIAQKGALLTAVSSILRYHQNRGELPAPNGTADPISLNQFLTALCEVDAKGNQLCDGFLSNPASGEQIVNLWRAANFTGGADVSVETATLPAIADLVAQGSPLLLSLGMALNGAPAGGHFVVATGIAGDGSIVIQDPSPFFARTNLNDYLNGFTPAGGGSWKANLRGVVRFVLQSPSGTRFLTAALSQSAVLMQKFTLDVRSAAGVCGAPLDLLDEVDGSSGTPSGAGPLVSRLQVCDGSQAAYQVTIGATQPFQALITDLASGGSSTDLSGGTVAAYEATRPLLNLAFAPLTTSFSANSVVNAATFTAGIAPGGLMTIFGTGLSGSASATTADMDGVAVPILFSSPFQINAVVPQSIAAGVHVLTVHSPYGASQQSVSVAAVAPAIFLVGNPPTGAVLNQNYTLNGPANPLPRGQVLSLYATGLGAVSSRGGYSVTNTAVSVVAGGTELPASFAGLAPGFIGLYQVNVTIPTSFPPNLGATLTLKQGGQMSNPVVVAFQ